MDAQTLERFRDQRIGVMVGAWSVESRPTVGQQLAWRSVGPQRLREILDLVGLDIDSTTPAGQMGDLERHQLALALALATDPAYVVVDDPGLHLQDPAREAFWNVLAGVHRPGYDHHRRRAPAGQRQPSRGRRGRDQHPLRQRERPGDANEHLTGPFDATPLGEVGRLNQMFTVSGIYARAYVTHDVPARADRVIRGAVTKRAHRVFMNPRAAALPVAALSALEQGYEVYIVVDASGGTTEEAHQTAIARMTQAGAIPVTWLAVTLEWQRDWARKETYEPVVKLIRQHAGAYGQGIEYAQVMWAAVNPRM